MDDSPSSVYPTAPPIDDHDHDELRETQPLLTHPSPTHDDYGAYEDDSEVHLDSPTFCETCLVTCMHYCDYVITLNMLFTLIAASGAVLYLFTNIILFYPAIKDFYLIFYLFVFMYFFVTCVRKCYDC